MSGARGHPPLEPGQQGSFLGKCWAEAAPSEPGQVRGSRGGSKPHSEAAPPAPNLHQGGRGSIPPGNSSTEALLPRDEVGEPGAPQAASAEVWTPDVQARTVAELRRLTATVIMPPGWRGPLARPSDREVRP